MVGVRQPLLERLQQARLADAGLTGQQHDLTLALARLLPAGDELGELRLAADHGQGPAVGPRHGYGGRVGSPVGSPVGGPDGSGGFGHGLLAGRQLPDIDRLGQARQLARALLDQLEHPLDERLRRLVHDDAVGRGQRLQPPGDVRRLADDRPLPVRVVADRGAAGGQADPGL